MALKWDAKPLLDINPEQDISPKHCAVSPRIMMHGILRSFVNLLTPSFYGAASIVSLTSAATVTLTTHVVHTGVKEVVKPVFLEKLKVDLTKQQGDINEFEAEYKTFIDGLFERFDVDSNGEISQDEFREGLIDFFDEVLEVIYLCTNRIGWSQKQDVGNKSYLRKEIVLGMYSFDDPENPEEKRGLKESVKEEFESVETALWEIFDIDHDKKITRDDLHKGMHQLLGSIHKYFDKFEKGLHGMQLLGSGLFLIGGFCAYKHISNAMS